jgi:hypothetical protein
MNLSFENKVRLGQFDDIHNFKLKEASGAAGGIDKLRSQIKKAISAIEKAQSTVLDAADELDELMIQATAMGGFVANTIPLHIKNHIAKLTEIADKQLGDITTGTNASSLQKIEELINNTPLGKFDTGDAETRRKQISMQPNLLNGPQSQITESQLNESSLEDVYRNFLKHQAENLDYDDNSLNFDKLKESQVLGQQFESDMMESVNIKLAKPIQTKKITEKLRAAADDNIFEQFDEDSHLTEGSLSFDKIKAFGGPDGMPLNFGALNTGINMVDNT